MSLLYKCDRCADVFQPPSLTPDEQVDPTTLEDQELYYRIYRAGGKDLCSNCLSALIKFMAQKN